jgi:hypothetical protein
MRYHARRFLADWEFEHIKGVARANREEHARLLAEKCRDDAAKANRNGRSQSHRQVKGGRRAVRAHAEKVSVR